MVELAAQAIVGALLAERADMQLVQHRLVPRPARASPGAAMVAPRIDHLARPVHVVGLEARDRVGHRLAVVEPEGVAAAGPRGGGGELEPAIRLCGSSGWPRRGRRAAATPGAGPAPRGESERRRPAGLAPNGMAWVKVALMRPPSSGWQTNRISERPGTWKTSPDGVHGVVARHRPDQSCRGCAASRHRRRSAAA